MEKHKHKISEVIFKCLKDPNLLNQLKKDPKKFLEKELKMQFPESYRLEVVQDTPKHGYLVIPSSEAIKELSDEDLKAIAAAGGGMTSTCTAWCM